MPGSHVQQVACTRCMQDEMTRILHDDRPTLIDSATGLLLWPVELVGALQNPMKLHAFPFDADVIEIHIHQNERSSRRKSPIVRVEPFLKRRNTPVKIISALSSFA